MEKSSKEFRKVEFAKVGKKKQHDVTLVGAYEAPFSWDQEPGPALPQLENINDELIEHFARKGIENPSSLFCFMNGNIVHYDEKVHNPTDARPLIAAIAQRDKSNGQTDDYFAAMAINFAGKLRVGIMRFLNGEDSSPGHLFWIINTALQIQEWHTNFHILRDVQPQYSAGKSRTTEAHEAKSLKEFEPESELLFREYRTQRNATGKTNSKQYCYREIAKELKRRYPEQRTPAKDTIEDWFKGRKDLP